MKTTIEKVNELYRKYNPPFLKKDAKYAFEIGNMLYELRLDVYIGDSWTQYVNEHFCFSVWQANTYIRIYFHYKDDPKVLDGLSISEAINNIRKGRQV